MPAVGTAPRDRGGQRDVHFGSRIPVKFNDRQVIRISRVGKPTNLGLPTQCGKSDLAMIQCRTAAEHQVAGVRVGPGQV